MWLFQRCRKPSLKLAACLALCLAAALVLAVLGGGASQRQREQEIVRGLYYWQDKEFLSRCEVLEKEQRYAEWVDLLELKCASYQEQVAALGGLREAARMIGHPRRCIADGTSALFCGMHRCMDYNAAFTPMDVEYILMQAMPDYPSPADGQQMQALAAHLSQSREPILKAYGLWTLGRRDDYRAFVYQHADRGEPWSYGFAANAAEDDTDPQRALKMLDLFECELLSGPYTSDYPLHYLDFQIAATAGKLGDTVCDASPRQRALIHRVLDRCLQTREGEAQPEITPLFILMGRPDDADRYLERIRINSERFFRSYMVEMLLQKKLPLNVFDGDTMRSMHRVLDEHLITGETPGITDEQMRSIFTVLGRGEEVGNQSH